MLRRIIALLLTCVLLSCPLLVLAEENEQNIVSQTEFNKSEEFLLLSSLNIVDEKDNPDAKITRQQFVEYAGKMLDGLVSSDKKYFVDTEDKSIANAFAEFKILKVGEDKKFRPNDYITHEEATIIILRILGYDSYLSRRGETTVEYFKTAKQLNISLKKDANSYITFKEMVKLLYNALNTDVFEAISFGEKVEFAQTDTLLKRIYDVSVIKGYFNANEWTSVYTDVPCPGKGRVVINKIKINAENSGFAESMLLGRMVRAYVKGADKDGIPELVLVVPENEKAEIYSFSSKNYIGANGATVKFYISEKEKSISLNYPTLVYNGVADFNAGRNEIIGLLDNYNTSVTIVKNSAESNAIVFVNEYKNAEITSVDTKNGYIYTKDTSGVSRKIQVEESGTVKKVLINNADSGEKENSTDIKAGDIISFGVSRDGKVVTILHCTKVLQGKVEELSGNLNNRFASIDGVSYPVNANLIGKQIEPGITASFYIGINGEIVAVRDAEDIWQTGYIYHFDDVNEPFSKIKYQYKVYTTAAKVKVFRCAERYILDGSVKNDDQAFFDRIAPAGNVDDRLRLFRYKINADGDFVNIDTASLLNEIPEDEKSLRILGEKLSRTFKKDTNSGYMMFKPNITTSGTTITAQSGENRIYPYPVNMSTEIFSVPHTASFEALDRNFTYSTVQKTSHIAKDKNSTCAFYNTDSKSDFVSIIVNYRNPASDYSEKSNPYLINAVDREVLNADGEICKAIEVITTVAVTSAKLTDTVLLDSFVEFTDIKGNKTLKTDAQVIQSLSAGDVIQYGSSASGCTGSIRILYDYDADDPNTTVDDNRGQVYWGWKDTSGNTLPVYSYRYTNGTQSSNLSVDFIGVYGYLLDSVVDADTQAQEDAYGRTAPSCYAFLGAVGAEGTDTIYGSAGWATGYRRLTMFDNSRRNNKAYWGIFTDLVNYRSSQTEYNYVLLFNGLTNQQSNCAVFYKR